MEYMTCNTSFPVQAMSDITKTWARRKAYCGKASRPMEVEAEASLVYGVWVNYCVT